MTERLSRHQRACTLLSGSKAQVCIYIRSFRNFRTLFQSLLFDTSLDHLCVPCPEFTLTAWVEVLPSVDPATVDRISILRKPMQTDTSLTCWGWFHAGEFRYGAHGILLE